MYFQNPWELPLPPPPRPGKPRSPVKLVVITTVVVLLALVSISVPIPIFFLYLPGPVRNVHELVEIDDVRTYSSEGQLLMTTVSVDTEVTLYEVLAASIDEHKDVVPAEDVTGGESLEDLQERNIRDMQVSKQAAREVVFEALGLSAQGALIRRTIEGSNAAKVLEVGDVIVSIGGTSVGGACDIRSVMANYEPGDQVPLTILRDDVTMDITIGALGHPEDPSFAFLGVDSAPFEPPVHVTFKTGQIAGPSAGLMFTLALYDRLTPDDLTSGRTIAGTGTINCDGSVGPIGGIEEKIAAAEQAGAEVFLAPAANYEAAKGAAGDIEVVSVDTFGDAVAFLEGR